MHLLLTQAGVVGDGGAVDLAQTPGDIVLLSAAASDLALLTRARTNLGDDFPSLRLANLMQLSHNLSVDLYLDSVVSKAQLVIARVLGGVGYWTYGIEQLQALCRDRGIALAVVPGDEAPDAELMGYSTLPLEACHRLWQYTVQGGIANAEQLLRYGAHLLGRDSAWREPVPLPRMGIYRERALWQAGRPVAAIVFYRALVQADDTAPVDALIAALNARGLNALALFANSLKDPPSADFVRHALADAGIDIVLNCMGFAVSTPGAAHATPFDEAYCPVLQIIFSGGTREAWEQGKSGLAPRDLAMSVALPEIDGRIISRAVSFKEAVAFDTATETALVRNAPEPSRIAFVADLAANWVRLRRTRPGQRRLAIVLANYPNKDGRLANGVGLDTPESVARSLGALAQAGYALGTDWPRSGAELMAQLIEGRTNARSGRRSDVTLPRDDYDRLFAQLPPSVRDAISQRWGAPETDPFFTEGAFHLPAHRHGNVLIAVQPARGYNIDPTASYHDPDLVPPHGYLAFYFYVRESFGAHAVVHFGKHGNLEWLPGKSIALDATCFPEVALGALPHLYPFIVNDPGEGTQAKRRAQAVVVDHLTPPLTRAESYGPLRELEALVDEYYLASGMDTRRLNVLRDEILALSARIGLDRDLGLGKDAAQALVEIDRHLCELKELQIRDGLHVFGRAPEGPQERDLLIALARTTLLPQLAKELSLGFNPLDCDMAEPWHGPRPDCLARFGGAWRSTGDTVERLERLAIERVEAGNLPHVEALRPVLRASAHGEIAGLLAGLDGRFVMPGPSGAPTRGRLDVLPTGRNFYSVDCRAVPTPAAWTLGWKSASLLIARHFQDHGEYPKRIAMSAWGTANMRTGGDDIAQALALMGVRPTWDRASSRVVGFEIIPATVLDRPRVDVVFRVSGFFRDAFPAQVDLVDAAARAVAALDEPATVNPLAGAPGHRVFGSMPGAYGAGLQTLIDERCWETDADLAEAYLAWGGYAYGNGAEGKDAREEFRARLGRVQAIVHNQDNREHDLLDSDDYYQFEGGIAAAVRHLSGAQPTIYHNDHSRPETPKVRTLKEEIARVVRARAANPKWIAGVMRHGYKGAFEIAATVDYLFAFAATARVVDSHHFDQLFDAYLGDPAVRAFMAEVNAPALAETAARFAEAIERGFWHPRSNSALDLLTTLKAAA
jgi:cobaltochelatase CobN